MYLTENFITRIYKELSQLKMKRQITQFENGQRNKNTPLSKKSGQKVWIESTLLKNIQMVSKQCEKMLSIISQ